jgi:hypothetical protein
MCNHIKYCNACQQLKCHTKSMDIYLLRKWKHGHRNSYVLVLSAGPAYKLQAVDGKIHELLALTMLDPATSSSAAQQYA